MYENPSSGLGSLLKYWVRAGEKIVVCQMQLIPGPIVFVHLRDWVERLALAEQVMFRIENIYFLLSFEPNIVSTKPPK